MAIHRNQLTASDPSNCASDPLKVATLKVKGTLGTDRILHRNSRIVGEESLIRICTALNIALCPLIDCWDFWGGLELRV